jgi:hypothetical protein
VQALAESVLLDKNIIIINIEKLEPPVKGKKIPP